MIVCNICGVALPGLQKQCRACSGRGIEKPSPVRDLLTPTQRRGSPDRWAKNYTTPPGRSSGSPLAKEHSANNTPLPVTPRHGEYLDVQATPGADLARVYGTLVDKAAGHPSCASCEKALSSDASIYLPTSAGESTSAEALCRSCYIVRFAKGSCEYCRLPVVGDEKGPHKGAHVRGRGEAIWHADCFCCKMCGLALYQHDHLLSLQGQPHCPSCYEHTLGTPKSLSLSRGIAAYPGRTHINKPTPPANQRRFAPPGLVIPRDHPVAEKQSSDISIPPANLLAAVPLRAQINHNNCDNESQRPGQHIPKDHSIQTKETQGLYRDTVKNLAKRFESLERPGLASAKQAGRRL